MPIVTNSRLTQKSSSKVNEGVRFFRDSHWWEVERGVEGNMNRYFQCKPVCYVETRSYSEMEIMDSLWRENEKVCSDRGTGRLDAGQNYRLDTKVVDIDHKRKNKKIADPVNMSKKETLKILLVGSKAKVKELKEKLHVNGIAQIDDWSPYQKRPDGEEVLTIIMQKY
jgi:hypothetical protein